MKRNKINIKQNLKKKQQKKQQLKTLKFRDVGQWWLTIRIVDDDWRWMIEVDWVCVVGKSVNLLPCQFTWQNFFSVCHQFAVFLIYFFFLIFFFFGPFHSLYAGKVCVSFQVFFSLYFLLIFRLLFVNFV